MKLEMKAISIFLILGTLYNSVKPAPTEQDYSQNIQNGIGNLEVLFAKSIKNDLQPEQNALFSSFNIYLSLSLLHLGASGETRNELSKTLGIPADETGSAAAHSHLAKILDDVQNTEAAEVLIGNLLFKQMGTKIKESYKRDVVNYHYHEVKEVNFAKGGSEATDYVNGEVASITKNRIPKLFKTEISPATQLLLASTLFFNASWAKPFQKLTTKNENFHTGVKEVKVPTMNQKANIPYVHCTDLNIEAISIPYDRQEFNMLIVLPDKNNSIGAFIDQFNLKHHQRAIKEFSSGSNNDRYVDYKIPRLKFGWSRNIDDYVRKSGVKKIFANAEFDNLVEEAKNLQVSHVNHATEIEVNEEGTIATAVTSIELSRPSPQLPPPESVKFYVDRPFSFSIYHRKTGVTLFTGIVQNPLT